MASQTDIINLALKKLGQDRGIASTAEKSKEARVFGSLWEPTRDIVLADRSWPWATKAAALALDGVDDPQPGWRYRYSRPNDCLTIIAVTDENGLRQAGGVSRFCNGDWLASAAGLSAFDFEPSYGSQGETINTNIEHAWLVYTVEVTDTGRYPPHFVDALAWRLAAEAAPAILGETGVRAKESLLSGYQTALALAATHDYNETRSRLRPVTASVAARY